MNNFFKRLMLGSGAMAMTLGGALATMQGGGDITFAQIGQVPLVAWLFSIGAFATGFIGSTDIKKPKLMGGST